MKEQDENVEGQKSEIEEKIEKFEHEIKNFPYKEFVEDSFTEKELHQSKAESIFMATLFTAVGSLHPVMIFYVPLALVVVEMVQFKKKRSSEE